MTDFGELLQSLTNLPANEHDGVRSDDRYWCLVTCLETFCGVAVGLKGAVRSALKDGECDLTILPAKRWRDIHLE